MNDTWPIGRLWHHLKPIWNTRSSLKKLCHHPKHIFSISFHHFNVMTSLMNYICPTWRSETRPDPPFYIYLLQNYSWTTPDPPEGSKLHLDPSIPIPMWKRCLWTTPDPSEDCITTQNPSKSLFLHSQLMTSFMTIASSIFVLTVRGGDGLSQSWTDYQLVDVADALFHLGVDRSLVLVHVHVQVRTAR